MILGFEIGSRSSETGKRLFEKIKSSSCQKYYTDYWPPYEKFLPPEKHIKSKAETYTIEGCNSLFRHYLARLHRKTKCYSKSLEMLISFATVSSNYKQNQPKLFLALILGSEQLILPFFLLLSITEA